MTLPPLILFLLMAMSALPASGKEPAVIIGAGTNSCGVWSDTIGRPAHNEYGGWVLGFISAFNVLALSTNGDVGKTTDAEGMLGWIDRYCTAHPLDQIETATMRLIEELQRRSGAR